MDNISHYNMDVSYIYTSFNIPLMWFTNCGASIMCHMQWFEIRQGLPSRPGSWPQKVSILFHMSRQAFPTFIIFQLFPSLSFYSNSLTTGSFSFEHILSILKGVGYMLKNLRSKNLIDHRNSIFLRSTQYPFGTCSVMMMDLMDKNDLLPTQAISNWMVFLFNTIAMILNISADCLHHNGISVSGDNSLIF